MSASTIQSSTTTPTGHHVAAVRSRNPNVLTVVIAVGKRPVPFRTRKLSLPTLMVLHSPGCGRVGHRRHTHLVSSPQPWAQPDTRPPGPGARTTPRGRVNTPQPRVTRFNHSPESLGQQDQHSCPKFANKPDKRCRRRGVPRQAGEHRRQTLLTGQHRPGWSPNLQTRPTSVTTLLAVCAHRAHPSRLGASTMLGVLARQLADRPGTYPNKSLQLHQSHSHATSQQSNTADTPQHTQHPQPHHTTCTQDGGGCRAC